MNKESLIDAIVERSDTKLIDVFPKVAEVDEGDTVIMDFLASPLTVTDVDREDETIKGVVMETKRGGRHRLTMKDGVARLQRWRKGAAKWMWNSDYPEELSIAEE